MAGRGPGGGGRGGPGGRFGGREGGGRGGRDGGGGRGPGGPGGLDAAVKMMTMTLSGLSLVTKEPPAMGQRALRPDFGKAGKQVQLYSNYFLVERTKAFKSTAYQFDVDIKTIRQVEEAEQAAGGEEQPAPSAAAEAAGAKARRLPAALCRKVVNKLAQDLKFPLGWGFDGQKNIFTLSPDLLPRVSTAHSVEIFDAMNGKERGRRFVVTTQLATAHDLGEIGRYVGTAGGDIPRAALQALDVCLRHTVLQNPAVVPVGRALHFYDETVTSLGGGADLYWGYHQSLKITAQGLMLNIDTAATSFLSAGPVADMLAAMLGVRSAGQLPAAIRDNLRKVQRALRGVKVETTGPGGERQVFVVSSVTSEGADKLTFPNRETGKNESVAHYFSSTKRQLRTPGLQCLDVGRVDRHIYIPLERCKVLPLQRKRKLDDNQTRLMQDNAKQSPDQKKRYIEEIVRDVAKFPSDPNFAAWGVSFKPDMFKVDARVLPQPMLQYGGGSVVDPGAGAWNLRSTRFYRPVPLKSMAVVCLVPKQDVDIPGPASLHAYLADQLRMLEVCGVPVEGPAKQPPVVYFDRRLSVEEHMRQAAEAARSKAGSCQMLMVLLPSKGKSMYQEVKRIGDCRLGIPTQCIVQQSAQVGAANHRGKPREQYTANVSLKINCKLGGTNCKLAGEAPQTLPFMRGPFMLMGADVTHPTPGAGPAEPSVAAVVASMGTYGRDADLGRWATRVLLQQGRQEVISDMQPVVQQMLGQYYAANKAPPSRIVYYRDGVAEGQYATVLDHEYRAIKAACAAMSPKYNPPVTFIVVTKRHHARFMAVDERLKDRSGNIPAGTVVDTGVTDPHAYDFFLNSHAGLLGTNRPGQYTVLVDENGFGSDGLQLLTYWTTFTYQRATRSVSYAAPAYYAHLAAFRGRLMVDVPDSDVESVTSGGTGGRGVTAEQIHPNFLNTMFYM